MADERCPICHSNWHDESMAIPGLLICNVCGHKFESEIKEEAK